MLKCYYRLKIQIKQLWIQTVNLFDFVCVLSLVYLFTLNNLNFSFKDLFHFNDKAFLTIISFEKNKKLNSDRSMASIVDENLFDAFFTIQTDKQLEGIINEKNELEISNQKFEVLKRLGQGQFGVAYKMVDTEKREEFVVKVVWADTQDKLGMMEQYYENYNAVKRKANKINKKLSEISRFFPEEVVKANINGQVVYLIKMKLADQNLQSHYLPKLNNLKKQFIVSWRVLKEILRELHELALYGVLYLDIKPENINWDSQENKFGLVDFDGILNRSYDHETSFISVSKAYTAESELKSQVPFTVYSEAYSLAVTLVSLFDTEKRFCFEGNNKDFSKTINLNKITDFFKILARTIMESRETNESLSFLEEQRFLFLKDFIESALEHQVEERVRKLRSVSIKFQGTKDEDIKVILRLIQKLEVILIQDHPEIAKRAGISIEVLQRVKSQRESAFRFQQSETSRVMLCHQLFKL